MFKKFPSSVPAFYWYGFLICIGLLVGAFYLENALTLAPCPLCQLQRILFLAIGLVCLTAALHKPQRPGVIVYSSLIGVFAVLGSLLAIHQLQLQAHPPAVSSNCGMGLSYLLDTLSVSQALKLAVMGTSDCATVTWRFLGLSLAGWSLIAFIIVGIMELYQIKRMPKH